jgi:hypothetical protein
VKRTPLAVLAILIALGAMTPPAADAQTAQFKGWPAIERELSTRLAPKDKPLDLYQFIPGDDMDDLLGTWFTVGSEHAFHNGMPNSVNMVIWHVALSGFAKSLGESCDKPRFVFHPHFAEVLKRMCTWPAETARSEAAMTDFWLSVMGYNAPEAKRCVMKRLFEYMVAENQTIDGGYLDELTRNFTREAEVNSSTAMREAIIRIVQSRSFHQRDPEPRQCYDSGPNGNPQLSPPCRVAFILQKNCTQCHDTVYGGEANLDLSAWVAAPDHKNRTFPHLDRDLKQFSVEETLTRIIDRLSSSDPKARMPKNRLMSSQERQELVLWAQEQLARIAKGERQ